METLLSGRKVELANLETITHYVDDLKNLLEESSLTERRSFIRSFVKQVKVTGDEVLLTYTMPLPPLGISEERAGVLCSAHYGGAEISISRTIKGFDLTFSLSIQSRTIGKRYDPER